MIIIIFSFKVKKDAIHHFTIQCPFTAYCKKYVGYKDNND